MVDPRVRAEFQASPAIERTYEDSRRGYRAYVVIDTLAGGHASGGIRIRAGVTLEELRSAARVMTWKYRFVGLPTGGAKAGIEGAEDLPREEKARRLAWLADKASDLIDSGVLGVGPDMGTDGGLIGDLLRERGLLERRRAFPSRFRGSGFYAALSTVEAAAAALALRGEGLRGKTAAIEGFGAVGSNVARLLSARGARVVAISTSNGALERADGLDIAGLLRSDNPLEGDARARRVAREELLRLEVDLVLPCGPGGTIDLEVAREIPAPVIAPGANSAFTLKSLRKSSSSRWRSAYVAGSPMSTTFTRSGRGSGLRPAVEKRPGCSAGGSIRTSPSRSARFSASYENGLRSRSRACRTR